MEQGARPDDAPARSHASPGGIVAAIGSALIVASTFFELVSATVGPEGRNQLSSSRTYLDSDNGKIVLVLGLLALVVSAATLIRPRRDIVWPIVVAACSLAALGLAVHDRIDLDDVGSEIRARFALSGAATDIVHVSIGPALYIAIAGGIVATVGAVVAARDRSA